ncbi:MAG: hypothetical protein JWO94_861, partial [Verrucomicrobiaceae bacterium]|nr:hypothetical protein [Verrucomicrobiaceae bacterium]
MILDAMLQRLYASLVSGPSMNARPHNSRQRVDLMELAAFNGQPPDQALSLLLQNRKLEFAARTPPFEAPKYPEAEWSNEQKQARDAHVRQGKLLKKLRDIAEAAKEYINDHGDSCLALGFPLLSLPGMGEDGGGRSTRILAPMLLMPVDLQVRTASRQGVTLQCVGEGADLLVANPALIAWLERQTGKPLAEGLFIDEEGADPWREIHSLLAQVSTMLGLDPPASLDAQALLQAVPVTDKLPKTAFVVPSAILGLFPLSNQDLLRDTRWMKSNETALQEPVSAFLKPEALHQDTSERATGDEPVAATRRDFGSEWQVSAADPCQANAVLAAREAKALVVHGPPGTGKSQTITNMIADHLARGQRVLFVCDKRTALDVVKYRLDAVGLGDLCGVVHDPGSDRKDFYMGLRSKLENLAEAPLPNDPRLDLKRVNDGLAAVHAELDGYRKLIHEVPGDGSLSFHELMGAWLELMARDDLPAVGTAADATLGDVEAARTGMDEIARRAERSGYGTNAFRQVLCISLPDLMAISNSDVQATFQALHEAAQTADAARPEQAWLLQGQPIATQRALRHAAAAALAPLPAMQQRDFARACLSTAGHSRTALRQELTQAAHWREQIAAAPLDRVSVSSIRSTGKMTLAQVNTHIASLVGWEAVAGSFFKKLLAGQVRKNALYAVMPLGLSLDAGWREALVFYRLLKLRLLMIDLLGRIGGSNSSDWIEDGDIEDRAAAAEAAWRADDALKAIAGQEDLETLIVDSQKLKTKARALEEQALWADKLQVLISLVERSRLFSASATASLETVWCKDEASPLTAKWLAQRSSLEDVVRLESAVEALPPSLRAVCMVLAVEGAPADKAMLSLARLAMENSLRERLARDASLATIDGERVEAAFATYHSLG